MYTRIQASLSICILLQHTLIVTCSYAQKPDGKPCVRVTYPKPPQKTSENSKQSKKLLPHQMPDFYDDCTRYYYWYYVNYMDTIQHPVVKKFLDSGGWIKTYNCFLEPFRQWESKNRKNLYCYALVDDYLRILAGLPLYKTNVSSYAKYPQFDGDMYYDFSLFDEAGVSISPENIKAGNVIGYYRIFMYYKTKVNQFRSFRSNRKGEREFTLPGHTAIIADILRHDKKNKIFIMVLLNKPHDYYSLALYDYKYNILVEDLNFINKYKPYKSIMNKTFEFNYADKSILVGPCKEWQWMCDPAPFVDCFFNLVNITETMNMYKLFEWYEENHIPYNKTIDKKTSKK